MGALSQRVAKCGNGSEVRQQILSPTNRFLTAVRIEYRFPGLRLKAVEFLHLKGNRPRAVFPAMVGDGVGEVSDGHIGAVVKALRLVVRVLGERKEDVGDGIAFLAIPVHRHGTLDMQSDVAGDFPDTAEPEERTLLHGFRLLARQNHMEHLLVADRKEESLDRIRFPPPAKRIEETETLRPDDDADTALTRLLISGVIGIENGIRLPLKRDRTARKKVR